MRLPILRRAAETDYDAFAELYARLRFVEPVPSLDAFRRLAPHLLLAEGESGVEGMVLIRRGSKTARIGMLAVSRKAEGRGLGRKMMFAAAAQLRSEGIKRWVLTVRRTNTRAMDLYASMGMKDISAGAYWCVARRAIARLPARAPGIRTRPAGPGDYVKLERAVAFPKGMLSGKHAERLLVAAHGGGRALGVALLQGADEDGLILLNAKNDGVIAPLLSELWPDEPTLAVFSTSKLVHDALHEVGAELLFETVEMEGPLPLRTASAV